MLALRELQTEFGRAVLGDGDAPATLLASLADDPFGEERIAIYRNNVQASLTAVLRDTFPVVCRLVDERFFAYAAHSFIQAHPPSRPALYEYGAAFARFLEGFPPCRELTYLPDVARLEWLLNVAATAPDQSPLSPAVLAQFRPEDTVGLRFTLDAQYLESVWPLERIWRASQLDATDDAVDLASGGSHLEIARLDGIVGFRVLDAATFAFRRALSEGALLGPALEQALSKDERFAPGEALAAVFRDGAVTAVTLTPSDQESAP